MGTPRSQSALDTLVTEFQGITVANGYHYTVANVVKAIRPVKLIMKFPEIGIELGDSVLEKFDSARTSWDEVIPVTVIAYVQTDLNAAAEPESANNLQEASENMCHDLRKKICTDLLTQYITGVSNRFNVELSNNQLTIGRMMLLGEQRGIGQLDAEFKIRIRAESATFE